MFSNGFGVCARMIKRISLKYRKKPKEDGWFKLLYWRDNIMYYLRAVKDIAILKFLHKCPNCFSPNL